MENNNAHQPAFPPNAGWKHAEAKGLSKREYFAGLAMQAAISAGTPGWARSEIIKQYAHFAVEAANALLDELSKQPK
jgi:hypothetical protein